MGCFTYFADYVLSLATKFFLELSTSFIQTKKTVALKDKLLQALVFFYKDKTTLPTVLVFSLTAGAAHAVMRWQLDLGLRRN